MMTINEKKEVLSQLTETEFGDMFGRLLGNQGFSNIKNEETSIICEQRIMGRTTVFSYFRLLRYIIFITLKSIHCIF